MCPEFMINNARNCRSAHAVFLSQCDMCDIARSISLPNSSNFVIRQFRHAVGYTLVLFRISLHCHSSLGVAIGRIFRACPKKQVGRVYAIRIIARMANHSVARNLSTVCQFPRKAVGVKMGFAGKAIDNHLAVPTRIVAPAPEPTRRTPFDLRPKAILKRQWQSLAAMCAELRHKFASHGVNCCMAFEGW